MINPKIFKAYDIRGVYPEEINEEVVYGIGQAYAEILNTQGPIAVGMDVRIHSQKLQKALIQGLLDFGVDVVDIGLVSTEMLYFAVGNYHLKGGIQVTASHNTAEYNGLKMTREKAIPLSSDTGIFEIRDIVVKNEPRIVNDKKGNLTEKNVLKDYAEFVLKFIDTDKIKPLKLVYNPSFGYQGILLEKVKEVGSLPLELIGLNHIPDGTFPKGRPDPFRQENRQEFIDTTKESQADLGVAWDADADRVFFCSKKGVFVEPYFINAVLIKKILEKNKGGKIVYDPRYTWALIDAAKEAGGEAILERVGHSFIKEKMRKEDAVFSGESSGHTYFKDFWYADSGIIPLLMLLEILSDGTELDNLLEPIFNKYFISGELNFETLNAKEILEELKKKYNDAETLEIDGLSLEYSDWRTNIRTSNTEPLLRVNIEGKSKEIVEAKKREITEIIKKQGKTGVQPLRSQGLNPC